MRHIKGSDLRAIRNFAGKTTLQMAHAAGVKTRKTYENWEKNVGTPNVNQFINMVEFCGLDPETLTHFLDVILKQSQNNVEAIHA